MGRRLSRVEHFLSDRQAGVFGGSGPALPSENLAAMAAVTSRDADPVFLMDALTRIEEDNLSGHGACLEVERYGYRHVEVLVFRCVNWGEQTWKCAAKRPFGHRTGVGLWIYTWIDSVVSDSERRCEGGSSNTGTGRGHTSRRGTVAGP
jgi:hypothetical protein